jgi:hypothetical protein
VSVSELVYKIVIHSFNTIQIQLSQQWSGSFSIY